LAARSATIVPASAFVITSCSLRSPSNTRLACYCAEF
jgi:hypothetical protein